MTSGVTEMARVIQASWKDFDRIVGSARDRLLVCSAYYSEDGLGHLVDAFPSGPCLTFVSRLSPSDWLNGVADPEALVLLLDLLRDDGRESRFIVHQRLHAKAYLADGVRGLVGSANLSTGGFDTNFEIMMDLDKEEAAAADRMIKQETVTYGVSLAPDSLRKWVTTYGSRIKDLRPDAPNASQLSDAQRTLDSLLGYGQAGAVEENIPDIEEYATWLDSHVILPGAGTLLDRLRNLSGQNLTGHVRQSYCAIVRFLQESPQYVDGLANGLDSLAGQDDIFRPDDALIAHWIRHLDEHATEQGAGWDYAVLRGVLPPNLGGTRTGGGGGSSTLKRMLPLVARFLQHRRGE